MMESLTPEQLEPLGRITSLASDPLQIETLTPEKVKELFDRLPPKEKDRFLKELLEKLPQNDRQDLIQKFAEQKGNSGWFFEILEKLGVELISQLVGKPLIELMAGTAKMLGSIAVQKFEAGKKAA